MHGDELKKNLAVFLILITLTNFTIIPASSSQLQSNDYFFNIEEVELFEPKQQNEGSITKLEDKILVIRRLGQFQLFGENLNQFNLSKESLQVSIPDFQQRRFGERGLEGVKGSIYNPLTKKLFVSYITVENQCATLKLRSFNFHPKLLKFLDTKLIWALPKCVPVLDLSPEFPEITPSNRQGQPNISQAGGKLVILKNQNLLLSIGNFGDEWKTQSKLESEIISKNEYLGKVIEVNPLTRKVGIYSSGHRNIQGMIKLTNGSILSTEHGAEGGDEINLLRKGNFYGWPFFSFGHNYSNEQGYYKSTIKLQSKIDLRPVLPIYAWSPSIAPTQIVEVDKSFGAKWKGDLLIGSLRDQSLRRIRLVNDRILLDERIPIGNRIRDMVLSGKFLYVLDDFGKLKRLSLLNRQLD